LETALPSLPKVVVVVSFVKLPASFPWGIMPQMTLQSPTAKVFDADRYNEGVECTEQLSSGVL
jgi:hypothetical protein